MTLLPLMLEALVAGGVTVRYGRIAGRCGYVDRATRTVTLNPDADPEQLAAELAYDLGALIGDTAAPVPTLELAHSVDEAEDPSPPRHRALPATARQSSGFRVVG